MDSSIYRADDGSEMGKPQDLALSEIPSVVRYREEKEGCFTKGLDFVMGVPVGEAERLARAHPDKIIGYTFKKTDPSYCYVKLHGAKFQEVEGWWSVLFHQSLTPVTAVADGSRKSLAHGDDLVLDNPNKVKNPLDMSISSQRTDLMVGTSLVGVPGRSVPTAERAQLSSTSSLDRTRLLDISSNGLLYGALQPQNVQTQQRSMVAQNEGQAEALKRALAEAQVKIEQQTLALAQARAEAEKQAAARKHAAAEAKALALVHARAQAQLHAQSQALALEARARKEAQARLEKQKWLQEQAFAQAKAAAHAQALARAQAQLQAQWHSQALAALAQAQSQARQRSEVLAAVQFHQKPCLEISRQVQTRRPETSRPVQATPRAEALRGVDVTVPPPKSTVRDPLGVSTEPVSIFSRPP